MPAEPGLSPAENFLQMIRADRECTQLEAETLDLSLLLHAEHGGGNNSAFAVHMVCGGRIIRPAYESVMPRRSGGQQR